MVEEIIKDAAAYSAVPGQVKKKYSDGRGIQTQLQKVTAHLPGDVGYRQVYWNPDEKAVWAVLSDSDNEQVHQRWHNALKAISGVRSVKTEAEHGPYGDPAWIRIKRAAALGALELPFRAGGAITGGPTPLSNAIVGGLLAGGAGYGLGALAEQALPEEYVERGRLRKTLGLVGAGIGSVPGISQAFLNHQISQGADKPLGIRALITPDDQVPISPHEHDWGNSLKQGAWLAMESALTELPKPNAHFQRAAAGFSKLAFETFGTEIKPVPVDAFNRAIWNDVHMGVNSARNNPYGTKSQWAANDEQPLHTPPAIGAAATGLVTGIQQMYGSPSMLSPQHFIRGLATAGVDMATARVAGGVLGALGGLTPPAQQKLQQMGLWGGFIRGVTSSVLGL